ncbi:MAG TPA: OpgC domain-containing protein [Stellaceae bacterium]|nr:OpgC domain-containing protein [Stellaceae bacterium]
MRDLRLDVFRGLSLFCIFVDHVPDNVMSFFTLQAIGFSDAAEVFIFISGYTAALVYGRAMDTHGIVVASARVLRRVWQLYVAHIFLFVIFTAEVSYTVMRSSNPMFNDELRVGDFLAEPHIAIIKALTLQFQPMFLDILPLYIVLLLIFPIILATARFGLAATLIPSALLYFIARWYNLNFMAFPADHAWYFDPLCWQFLFVIGASFGYAKVAGRDLVPRGRWVLIAAGIAATAAAIIRFSWLLHGILDSVPELWLKQLWPIDKTTLAPIRLFNFLALALLVARLVPPSARILSSGFAWPFLICGRNSLHVFCFSILLSVLGHFILVEWNGGVAMQVCVTLIGLGLLVLLAMLLTWYRRSDTPGGRSTIALNGATE